ncbi:hypothetical protein EX895_000079 [Sporisorium graminicola]|uniref:Mid2 domain-containing protein n=1 Tax=Sporisorium graminicola TaxID=280036 RepID=A0A4U7KYX8_9BASI|nr:hypothetical protein EX895_000079 [Sporisorium graminicola]TKY90081.1 hypothetical protein EX895_000079 [Sporisorium graminicola]
MVTITRSLLLRLSTLAVLLLTAASSIPTANALSFSVESVNCTSLDWTITLSSTEWSVASYVELFFVSTQGARNYSLLYSASPVGVFPSPATYSKVTMFGATRLSGGYRIGIGLADVNGNLMTTTSSSSSGGVQVTAIDARTFTFGNCVSNSPSGAVAGATASSAATSARTSQAAAISSSSAVATQAGTASAAPLASATSASSSTAASAASGTLSPASASATRTTAAINKGAIAGGVVGGLLLLLIALALLRWCTSRRRTRRLSMAAAQRMSGLRPLELSEKLSASSPAAAHRTATARSFNMSESGDPFEAVAEGRLSGTSGRKSVGWTTRSGSRMSVVYGLDREQEGRAEHDATFSHAAAGPYFGRSVGAQSSEHIPAYPTAQQHQRSKSAPLVLELPQISATPLTSPMEGPFRSITRTPSTSTFRIPRVTVPAYHTQDDGDAAAAAAAAAAAGEAYTVQLSRSSSTKRLSTGGATSVSLDEGPFFDASQDRSHLDAEEYHKTHV